MSLGFAFDSHFPGHLQTTLADLEHATALAVKLLKLAALRDSRRVLTLAASEQRLRAFTLLHHAYGQARRAVQYVRWEQNDADKIAPSFYGSKRGRRRHIGSDDDPSVPSEPITTPPVTAAPRVAATAQVLESALPVDHRAIAVQGVSTATLLDAPGAEVLVVKV